MKVTVGGRWLRMALLGMLLLGLSAAGAQAFDKEIKLCKGEDNVWINGLNPDKPTHVAASCVKGESQVNWQVDVIATQGGGLVGNGFECAGRYPWSYKNTYYHATNLQYFGQVGCVLLRITQD